MVKIVDGVEIKIQANKKDQPKVRTLLMEKFTENRNVEQVSKLGEDRLRAVADLPVAQREIEKVIEENGLKKSQFVVKRVKIRVD